MSDGQKERVGLIGRIGLAWRAFRDRKDKVDAEYLRSMKDLDTWKKGQEEALHKISEDIKNRYDSIDVGESAGSSESLARQAEEDADTKRLMEDAEKALAEGT